ncbi:hypothetical protein CLAFUW4_06219 [Fulvia fulva]|uniref:SnoaL-like domain-containing protein n=1 Tax=Passalora fulva TaxID=5499 RepID=A0A9Q8P9S5_PASFU|nr:uncharacterized protein CLAFUR5_06362 [Fulvia fulva]KAK4624537.1 hypothetical protein CLAFUR4_06222 [Fulvia fulva]KAK4625386.1 hypothetical protein CLAFUR0_06226 [Fulvia fulva]UJO18256.1 hypothetical protein CLAFUR5_06362 [Fulvia fulva]WPV14494.1 hypothetical protein CLAFUW4_06219 [Fulvia fulva]WPV29943.1 hypothetical protein CLAFUW7_06215 [Fulvia fulva]
MATQQTYDGLRAWYFEYLATIQAYNFDALGKFFNDDFVMQGQKIGRVGFQNTLKTQIQSWPQLRWMPRRIAIDMEQGPMICGWFDMSHDGKNGEMVHFQEVAFYTMRDGKMADVVVMFPGPVPEGDPTPRSGQQGDGVSKL